MRNLTPDAIVNVAIRSGLKMGEKAQPTFIEKFKENLAVEMQSLDRSSPTIIARALLAKGLSKRRAGELVGVDSTIISSMLTYKRELGDGNNRERWTAGALSQEPRYKELRLNDDEIEFLITTYPKMQTEVEELRKQFSVEVPEFSEQD